MTALDYFGGPGDWRTDAACRGMDTALFFCAPGESTAAAVAVCASCPVSTECLDYALSCDETLAGIWGGTTARARRRLRRERRRQAA